MMRKLYYTYKLCYHMTQNRIKYLHTMHSNKYLTSTQIYIPQGCLEIKTGLGVQSSLFITRITDYTFSCS